MLITYLSFNVVFIFDVSVINMPILRLKVLTIDLCLFQQGPLIVSVLPQWEPMIQLLLLYTSLWVSPSHCIEISKNAFSVAEEVAAF